MLKKIADKINLIRKVLKVNTASGPILGPIGTLDLNIEEQTVRHNFIVCTKYKQHLILGLDFAQDTKLALTGILMENYSLDVKAKR